MNEILEEIKSEITEIKKQQKELKDLTKKSDRIMKETKQLSQQQKADKKYDKAVKEAKVLKQEADKIKDKESGIYKDVSKKLETKHHEIVEMLTAKKQKHELEVEAKKQELVRVLKDKKSKEKAIEEIIATKREKIQKEIEAKKQFIDKNRKVDLKNIDVESLKSEKENLERQIQLNGITKEEFQKKSDSEKKEIRKAKEKYLINKHRLAEITPTIELIDTLDGKTPQEKYMEWEDLGKTIELNFNKDGLDNILKKLEEKDKNKQNQNQEEKEETEDFNKNHSNVHFGQESFNIEKRVKNIEILEDVGIIIWSDDEKSLKSANIEEAFSEKKEKFNRLAISEICATIAGSRIGGFILERKLNPEIVTVLDNYQEQLKEYISSIYNKTELPFALVHDLSKTNFVTKIKRSLFTRIEEKLGATVLGKLFNKNIAIGEAKNEKEVKSEQVEKETKKPIDAYRDVIDTKTQAKNTEEILKQQEERTAKDVEKLMGDAVLDKEEKVVAHLPEDGNEK